MTSRRLSALSKLLDRVRNVAKPVGKQSELARFLGSPRQQVNGWLKGSRTPGGEVTLLMLQWVTAEEAKQQKETLGSATNTAKGHKTRQLKSYHEKSHRVR